MITCRNVSLLYNNNKGIKDLNITINNGESILLAGLCGSGKSLALQLCTSLLKPQSGAIYLDDKPIDTIGKDYFRKVGILFQNSFFGIMNEKVWDEIIFSLQCKELDNIETRALNSLKQFNLLDLKDANPYYLSNGQLKTLYLAILFASDAEYFFLDEPTANLDYANTKILFKHLSYLKSLGKTICIASHDLEVFYEFSDKIILLDSGVSITYEKEEFNNIDFTKYNLPNPNILIRKQL